MIEINLYRIQQELLQNTIKHAAATQVHITLESKSDRLLLYYSDNGNGFDTNNTVVGSGLLNIQNRVMLLKGAVHFHSGRQAGVGVRIDVSATVNRNKEI
ncbi:sensor histidine kinase [Ravibacter arvi]|uniref:sensor histidine kinase n=1 Tax=Ravibacter arvi TaxID=2051041 RepID=UPI0031EE39F1